MGRREKRKRRARGKGSAFERKICKQLSLWLTNSAREDCLWRSSNSGGRATSAMKRGKDLARAAGDISAISPEGHWLTSRYFVEIKHYRNLDIQSLIKMQGKLWKFWCKACQQAHQHHRMPLLIARQNNFPTMLIGARQDILRLVPAEKHLPERLTGQRGMSIYLYEDLLNAPCALKS